MTVAELIDKLMRYSPDLPVIFDTGIRFETVDEAKLEQIWWNDSEGQKTVVVMH